MIRDPETPMVAKIMILFILGICLAIGVTAASTMVGVTLRALM